MSDDTTDAMEALQPRTVPLTPGHEAAPAYQPQMEGRIAPQPVLVEIEDLPIREGALNVQFAIGKLNDYLQWFLMVLEIMLGLRFLLKMLGADPASIFANFIFSLTGVLLIPFQGTAPTISLHIHQAFEFSTLFAAVIYFLLFYALKRFLRITSE